MTNRHKLFVLTIILVFSVAVSGSQPAVASDPRPITPSQKIAPLKDDIDDMMQQRAVQRSAPKPEHDEGKNASNDTDEGGEKVTEESMQEPKGQD